MAPKFSYEQIDLLDQMSALCDTASAEETVAQVRALADAGSHDAGTLIAQWQFWERYEARLASGRHLAAQTVSLMIYDASKAVFNMEVQA